MLIIGGVIEGAAQGVEGEAEAVKVLEVVLVLATETATTNQITLNTQDAADPDHRLALLTLLILADHPHPLLDATELTLARPNTESHMAWVLRRQYA